MFCFRLEVKSRQFDGHFQGFSSVLLGKGLHLHHWVLIYVHFESFSHQKRRKTGGKANLNYLLQFGSQIRNNLHHFGVNLSTFHFIWEEDGANLIHFGHLWCKFHMDFEFFLIK